MKKIVIQHQHCCIAWGHSYIIQTFSKIIDRMLKFVEAKGHNILDIASRDGSSATILRGARHKFYPICVPHFVAFHSVASCFKLVS